MGMRESTGCKLCDEAPWPGIPSAWQPVGELPDAPAWIHGIQAHRCSICGRVWHTPYDPKDGVHYPAMKPFSTRIDALLAQGAGLPAVFAFIDAEGDAEGMVSLAQTFFLKEPFDLSAALIGLIERLPSGGDRKAAFRILLLIAAAFWGEAGLSAWKLRHSTGAPRLHDSAVKRLLATMAYLESATDTNTSLDAQLLTEIRRKISSWGSRLRA